MDGQLIVSRLLCGFAMFVILVCGRQMSRASHGSPDRHHAKVQVLLWSGVLFANLPSALHVEVTSLRTVAAVIAGTFLVATSVELSRAKKIRQAWIARS